MLYNDAMADAADILQKVDDIECDYYSKAVFEDKSAPINLWVIGGADGIPGNLHAHEYIQICYVNKGSCIHKVGKSEHKIIKGDIFIIPPQVYHKLEMISGEEIEIYECEFMPSFINEKFENLDYNSGVFDFVYIEPFLVLENSVRPKLNLSDQIRVRIEDLFHDMIDELRNKKDDYKHCLKADLLKLLVLTGREYSKSGASIDETSEGLIFKYREAVIRTIKYINDNYMNDLNLGDVCRYSMMSQTYFSGLFKQLTKKTFIEYINHLRINKAMQLLKENEKSIKDICWSIGFNGITNFNRAFRKITGVSPSVYRKIISTR
jgi:AraC-like DNA-binding protein/quercetin dioxygenase-like cupin family protein